MNKSVVFLCALALGAFGAHAQTSSGNMMVGGGIDFQSTSYQAGSDNDESSVTFSPSFGYFVSDNFAVGLSLALSSSRTGTGSGKTVQNIFGIGPFARYYLGTSSENFKFFAHAELAFGGVKTDPPVGNVARGSFVGFSLSPGAAYFFNEHWAVEFAITGFELVSVDPDKDDNNDKVTTIKLGLTSFSPSLGFRYHF